MISNFSSFGDPEIARFVHILASKPDSAQEPTLPGHLDALLNQPWNPQASKLIDAWLWYVSTEFDLVGGAR